MPTVLHKTSFTAGTITTNLSFSAWTQVFTNARLCKALLYRITDRAHIIETSTDSYRFKRTVKKRQAESRPNGGSLLVVTTSKRPEHFG